MTKRKSAKVGTFESMERDLKSFYREQRSPWTCVKILFYSYLNISFICVDC